MVSASVALLLFLALCAVEVKGQEPFAPTANPSNPTPAPCIGGDPNTCVCVVNEHRFNAGETYQQLSDPQRPDQNITAPGLTASAVDFVFVVDESGSMVDEHFWLRGMIHQLDEALRQMGIGNSSQTPNRYGLVGFGSWKGRGVIEPTAYRMPSGSLLGSVDEFRDVLKELQTNGQIEDGYRAIQFALTEYASEIQERRAARQIVLITDEDVDNRSGISYQSILRQLLQFSPNETELSPRLNVIVNHHFRSGEVEALGVTSTRLAYIESSRSVNKYVVAFNGEAVPDGGHGNTLDHYVHLAWDTQGAAWNLNKLFSGGLPVDAFMKAFIDVKVEEVLSQLYQCVACKCSPGSSQFEALCNVSHVSSPVECSGIPGEDAFCLYKEQFYDVADQFRDFDVLEGGEPLCVDVVFVVDESGSMRNEHEWLETLAVMMDNNFLNRKIGSESMVPNQYGLIGFGSNIPGADKGRVYNFTANSWSKVPIAVTTSTNPFIDLLPQYDVPSHVWGSAKQLSDVLNQGRQAGGLFTGGRLEDAYSAIATALKYYPFREKCARHIVLVTDEGRDHLVPLRKDQLQAILIDQKFILNVAIDLSFKSGGERGKGVLGCDHLAQGYEEVRDRSNPAGYRIRQGCDVVRGSGTRSTETDYYHLANSTGGAAWDLKWLREGGHAGRAFTNAFIQVAVQETVRAFKVCKECNCTEEGVKCTVVKTGQLEIDCLIEPADEVMPTQPTEATPSPFNVTNPPSFTQCTNPYNVSVKFDHGTSLDPPLEVNTCVERLLCSDGTVRLQVNPSCPEVNCTNTIFPSPPNCCPVCRGDPTVKPTETLDIDYTTLQSTGPRGRKVTVKPADLISAANQTAVLACITQRFARTISSITWYKDGKLINYTASHRYAVSRGGNRFVIAMVTGGEDDGVFTCVVEQKNGNLYGSSASVKVEADGSFVPDCFTFDGCSSFFSVKDWSAFTGVMMPTAVTDFSLSFKPTRDTGAIFSAFDERCSEHMLVALCQGVLKLSVNLGAGRTELSANNVVMNEWNTLSVSRISNALSMTVNGVNTQRYASMKRSGLGATDLWIGTGETTWRCRILWANLMCSAASIYFEGSIRSVTSRLGGGPVDLTASSIASGYNVAHCPVG